MLPRHVFYELLDVGPFLLLKGSQAYPLVYEVPSPRKGQVTVRCRDLHSAYTGGAEDVLARLNTVLIDDGIMRQPRLEAPEIPSYDTGCIITYSIESGSKRRIWPRRDFEAVILYGDHPIANPTLSIYEVREGRKATLHMAITDDGNSTVEIAQLSRRAVPKPIHALIAAAGMSWTGSPDAETSYLELYGEESFRLARTAGEVREKLWMDVLIETKERLFGQGGQAYP